MVEKLVQTLFWTIIIGNIFGSNFIQFAYIACASQLLPKYIKTKVQIVCFYLLQSWFKKKKRSGTSLPASFFTWFLRKIIKLHSINGPNFVFWRPILLEVLKNMCILNNRFSTDDVINSKINISFFMKLFFHMTKKVRTKIEGVKRDFKVK